jgi:quercetin dioxygenase-like cupin family protein
MKRATLFAVALGLALILPLIAHEPEKKTHVMFKGTDLKWSDGPPSLPKGSRMVVLEGDPADEGIFTMRLRLPANYRIAPHWHPAWEHVTVIDGSFWMGRGEKFNANALQEVPAGGFAAMAAGTRHFAMTKSGTTIQLHGMGPWQIIYVNSADDPRKK